MEKEIARGSFLLNRRYKLRERQFCGGADFISGLMKTVSIDQFETRLVEVARGERKQEVQLGSGRDVQPRFEESEVFVERIRLP